jgi:hypothetical protein
VPSADHSAQLLTKILAQLGVVSLPMVAALSRLHLFISSQPPRLYHLAHGSLVWAKLKGWQWWPAMVTGKGSSGCRSGLEQSYTVSFFPLEERASVTIANLRPFCSGPGTQNSTVNKTGVLSLVPIILGCCVSLNLTLPLHACLPVLAQALKLKAAVEAAHAHRARGGATHVDAADTADTDAADSDAGTDSVDSDTPLQPEGEKGRSSGSHGDHQPMGKRALGEVARRLETEPVTAYEMRTAKRRSSIFSRKIPLRSSEHGAVSSFDDAPAAASRSLAASSDDSSLRHSRYTALHGAFKQADAPRVDIHVTNVKMCRRCYWRKPRRLALDDRVDLLRRNLLEMYLRQADVYGSSKIIAYLTSGGD